MVGAMTAEKEEWLQVHIWAYSVPIRTAKLLFLLLTYCISGKQTSSINLELYIFSSVLTRRSLCWPLWAVCQVVLRTTPSCSLSYMLDRQNLMRSHLVRRSRILLSFWHSFHSASSKSNFHFHRVSWRISRSALLVAYDGIFSKAYMVLLQCILQRISWQSVPFTVDGWS